jgi:HSP20 family molecular chaperone IbpA
MTGNTGFDNEFLNKFLDNYSVGVNWFPSIGVQAGITYPPYNILKLSNDNYVIELAVAGFSKDDISISEDKDTLIISGDMKSPTQTDLKYLHKGIAGRKFKREFALGKNIKVLDAKLDNGILSISLVDEHQNNVKAIPIL